MTVTEYFLAGFEGLIPAAYTADVAVWDPIADAVDGTLIATTPANVEPDYAVADAPIDDSIDDAGDADDATYHLNFIAGNARGYEIVIVGANTGYLRTIRQIFRPDPDGDANVVPLSQPETLAIKLTAADSYSVYLRGFNPLDEDNGLADFNEGDGDGFSLLTGSPIVVGADQDSATPAKPTNLLPKQDDLITLADGETTITRTLLWDSVPGATAYFVYLSASNAAPLLNYVNVGTATSVTVTMPAGTYSWMVIAQTEGATTPFGEYSDAQQFTVVGDIAGPVTTGLTLVGDEVRLVLADGSAVPDRVDVRHFAEDDNGGSWTLLGELTIGANNAIQGLPTLPEGINYFRIKAIAADGSEGPSQLFSVDVPADDD
jgi:hypothetical protein